MTRRCPTCNQPIDCDDEQGPGALAMLIFCAVLFGGGWLFFVYLVNG